MYAQASSHGIGGDPVKLGYACTVTAGSMLPVSRKGSVYIVDGSATINRLTPLPKGTQIELHFNGAPTLAHSTLLVMPGAANVTMDAGSAATFVSLGNGVWRCVYLFANFSRTMAGVLDASTLRSLIGIGAETGIDNHNRLVNPSGRFYQAGLASASDGSYTGFDQWLALTQSNPITPSQLTAVENGTPYMMRMTQANASAQRMGWLQWIENGNCSDLRGKTVTLSARVRMSASTTLRYAIIEWTGTADSITKDIVLDWTNATFTPGNFFTSTSTIVTATGSTALTANTLATVTLSGAISGSVNNVAVFFWTDSTQAQNVTLDLAKVQLEAGAVATTFYPRPTQAELALCQRYYEKSYDVDVSPGDTGTAGAWDTIFGNATTGELRGLVQYKVSKMKVPTVTLYDAAGASGFVYKGANGKTAAVNASGRNSFGGGTTDATSAAELYFHWIADARL